MDPASRPCITASCLKKQALKQETSSCEIPMQTGDEGEASGREPPLTPPSGEAEICKRRDRKKGSKRPENAFKTGSLSTVFLGGSWTLKLDRYL